MPGKKVSRMPKLTIVLPTYRRPALLRQTIASVLAQDTPDFKLLIVDDASNDATPEAVAAYKDPRIDYRRRPANIGLVANFFESLHWVESDYFCWLGDDDLYEPGFVGRAVQFLDAHPEVDFLWTRFSWFQEKAGAIERLKTENRDFPEQSIQDGAQVLRDYLNGRNQGLRITCQVFRTDWFKAGHFTWTDSPQFDILLRLQALRRARKVGHLTDVLFLARQHASRYTNQQGEEKTDLWRLDTQARIRQFIRQNRAYLMAQEIGVLGPLWNVFTVTIQRIVKAHSLKALNAGVRLSLTVAGDLSVEVVGAALTLALCPLYAVRQILRRAKRAAKGLQS